MLVSGAFLQALVFATFGAATAGMQSASADDSSASVALFSAGNGSIPRSWEAMTFPKVKEHTHYKAVRETENGPWIVEASSQAGAAGLMHRTQIDIARTPVLRWRWKVEGVLLKGDARTKEGDDYPARVYLIFDPDLDELTFFQRAGLRVARGLYGDVPGRAISYLWASQLEQGAVVDSPYAGSFAKLVAVKSGDADAGAWHVETRDVAADYRRLFGSEPAPLVGVAIMTDSDDTKEAVRAWYGDIRFLSRDELSREKRSGKDALDAN